MKTPLKNLLSATLTVGYTFSLDAKPIEGHQPDSGNPIIPGYFADPSIVTYEGKHYIYATIDPWGGETLGCWESDDLSNWTFRHLNWPTKTECTGDTSMSAMVWAPSVIEGTDGRFYMHVSVGSEVWAGVADHPLGPWQNQLGDKPLIDADFDRDYHMIDAQAFIDHDDSTYLYWGSGWNWVNGACFVAKMSDGMESFDGEVKNVTPSHYFEAPVMVEKDGTYFLMYSDGKTTEDTYQVHYATGSNPMGPFAEAPNSPILVTDHSKNVSSPGHHTVFQRKQQHYILYHRHNIPFEPVRRQICLEEMNFNEDGLIDEIDPSHQGPSFLPERYEAQKPFPATASASSTRNDLTQAALVLDNNYASRWSAKADDSTPWIQLDFGTERKLSEIFLRPEYPASEQFFKVQTSRDGKRWSTAFDFTSDPTIGSPILLEREIETRYLRVLFTQNSEETPAALFELSYK